MIMLTLADQHRAQLFPWLRQTYPALLRADLLERHRTLAADTWPAATAWRAESPRGRPGRFPIVGVSSPAGCACRQQSYPTQHPAQAKWREHGPSVHCE